MFLYAANSTKIATYGSKLISLDFGLRRAFVWNFVVADVSRPILGADFLERFGLLVDVKNQTLGLTTLNFSQTLGLTTFKL